MELRVTPGPPRIVTPKGCRRRYLRREAGRAGGGGGEGNRAGLCSQRHTYTPVFAHFVLPSPCENGMLSVLLQEKGVKVTYMRVQISQNRLSRYGRESGLQPYAIFGCRIRFLTLMCEPQSRFWGQTTEKLRVILAPIVPKTRLQS